MLVLEDIAATHYPNSFVHFDCPLDFMGYAGVTAEIVATDSPALSGDHVTTIGLLAVPSLRIGVPTTWREMFCDRRGRPWRIDLYVPSNLFKTVQEACTRAGP